MNYKQNSLLFILSFFLLSFTVSLPGCGGGSKGTGGLQPRVFEGRVLVDIQELTRLGVSLAGIKVTIAESGDFDFTDEFGDYSISTQTSGDSVLYIFSEQGVDVQFLLENVDESSTTVSVDFEITADRRGISPTRINVVSGNKTTADFDLEPNP